MVSTQPSTRGGVLAGRGVPFLQSHAGSLALWDFVFAFFFLFFFWGEAGDWCCRGALLGLSVSFTLAFINESGRWAACTD
ncbi:hypothetical protein BJ508DRAFT_133848 [Ascobolus immersus RN42]|uniref:Uncharacterized protein n=1 Tax=Ascobolus immersus RN42 TaxID=1160509 RepID=A0A3N4INY3_ASCIM|nr:hypothetical protein BJ508DRAFT_133848 [Ascobolus immersus RN42]